MINEHDCVVLTEDVVAEGLQAGDVGTVVHIHRDGVGYEEEFVTLTGQTVAVMTLLAAQGGSFLCPHSFARRPAPSNPTVAVPAEAREGRQAIVPGRTFPRAMPGLARQESDWSSRSVAAKSGLKMGPAVQAGIRGRGEVSSPAPCLR